MSSTLPLNQILALVGKLDDAEGEEAPRARFRSFLQQNMREVGQIQDYIRECLRSSGDQYNRALQDLVNHLGSFLEFEVIFGRYQGVIGKNGFDGHWKSPTGFHIVVEVKTTDAYAIQSATLLGYVDRLTSEQKIPNWDQALGLYVVGRPDAELKQLENAILAERRTHQLRIISTESLLSLAEMMNEYKVTHEEILSLLRPSGPKIDPIVDLMARLVAKRKAEKSPSLERELSQPSVLQESPYAPVEIFKETGSSVTTSISSSPIFSLNLPGGFGYAEARKGSKDDELVVLKGSPAKKDYQPSLLNYIAHREKLCQEGKLRLNEQGTILIFTEDVSFSSPSAAACIIRGTSTNGPKEWKVKGTEQTYGEWKDRSQKPLTT